MASTGKSDLLNKDKLKPEMEALAAKILRENKNIKKVEIKAELETKTARTSKGGQAGKAGSKQEQAKAGQDKKQPVGKNPSEEAGGGKPGEEKGEEKSDEANQPKEESGAEKPKAEDEAEKLPAGDTAENKERPGQEPDGKKPDEKEPEGANKEEGAKKEDENGGEKEGEEKPEEQEKDDGEKEDGKNGEKAAGEMPGQEPGTDEQANKAPEMLKSPQEENDAAGKLREEKSSSAKATEDESAETEAGTGGETQSLRQRVMAARQALNLKEQAKKKLEEKVLAPAKLGLNELLKQAWINLPDSFGLTLIWINIHVFLRWSVSDKLFCALGEEWLPKQVTAAGGDATKTAGKGIGLIEIIVLLILDLIVLAVILGVLALLIMIVDFMQAGVLDKIKMFIGGLTGIGWSGIKALYNLFAS